MNEVKILHGDRVSVSGREGTVTDVSKGIDPWNENVVEWYTVVWPNGSFNVFKVEQLEKIGSIRDLPVSELMWDGKSWIKKI